MSDYYEEVEEESLAKRIFKAVLLFIFAPLFIGGGYLLIEYAEEKRAESNATLKSMQDQAVEINTFDSKNNGNIVYLKNKITTSGTVKDSEFGVETNGIRLYRQVLTYQWEEKKETKSRKKNRGGSTTNKKSYKYTKVWAIDKTISSENFKYKEGHENTVFVKVKPKKYNNESVQMGDFSLSPNLVEQFTYFEPYKNISTTTYQGNEAIVDTGKVVQCASAQDVFKKLIDTQDPKDWENAEEELTNSTKGKFFFMGQGSPQHPVIGDVKVVFWEVPVNQKYSVVAGQNNKTLQVHTVEGGDIFTQTACEWVVHTNGTTINSNQNSTDTNEFAIIGYGEQDLSDLFSEAKNSNSFLYSFIFRIIAFMLFLVGFIGYKYITVVIHDAVSENPSDSFENKVLHSCLLLAYATTVGVVGNEWAKYNTVADLTVWDNYFTALILLIINSGYRLAISSGGEEMDTGEGFGEE